MPLSDGDPAQDEDTWFRVITDKTYFRQDGRLKNRAFTGKAISPPDDKRPWAHELSGRLLSLAVDVGAEATQFCSAIQKEFAGVMYSPVMALRFTVDKIKSDVRYTPRGGDSAHSDFVTFGSTEEDLPAIRDKLQEIVKALRPDQSADLKRQPATSSAQKPD